MHFEIRKNLFLGAFPKNYDEIRQYTHIINATTNFLPFYRDNPGEYRFTYLNVPLLDIDNITPYIDKIVGFIDNALKKGGKIYVHCMFGINRSTSCIIAYLALKESRDAWECLREIREKKPDVNPVMLFLNQINERSGFSGSHRDPLWNFHQKLRDRKNHP